MKTIINWLLEKTILGKLSGYKTYIGSAIMAITGLMTVLTQLLGIFPDVEVLSTIQAFLVKIKVWLETVNAHDLGMLFLGTGLYHKFNKGQLRSK